MKISWLHCHKSDIFIISEPLSNELWCHLLVVVEEEEDHISWKPCNIWWSSVCHSQGTLKTLALFVQERLCVFVSCSKSIFCLCQKTIQIQIQRHTQLSALWRLEEVPGHFKSVLVCVWLNWLLVDLTSPKWCNTFFERDFFLAENTFNGNLTLTPL